MAPSYGVGTQRQAFVDSKKCKDSCSNEEQIEQYVQQTANPKESAVGNSVGMCFGTDMAVGRNIEVA